MAVRSSASSVPPAGGMPSKTPTAQSPHATSRTEHVSQSMSMTMTSLPKRQVTGPAHPLEPFIARQPRGPVRQNRIDRWQLDGAPAASTAGEAFDQRRGWERPRPCLPYTLGDLPIA